MLPRTRIFTLNLCEYKVAGIVGTECDSQNTYVWANKRSAPVAEL